MSDEATRPRLPTRIARLAETLGVGLFWAICARLSPEWAGAFGARVAGLMGLFSHRTAILQRNLEVAFPDRSPAEIRAFVRSAWRNAGTVFGEYPHLKTISDPSSGRVSISAHPEAPLNQKAVFLAPHLASWEVIAAAPVSYGTKMTAVYSPRPNGVVDGWLRGYRAGLSGVTVIPRDASGLTLFRELKQGNAVGLIADRRDGKGVKVSFFGHMRSVSLVPARLALKSGAALATVHVRRTGPARYHVYLDRAIAPPSGNVAIEAQAEAMMSEVSARYESYIRQAPGDWFCMNRLWPKKVTGAWKKRVAGQEHVPVQGMQSL